MKYKEVLTDRVETITTLMETLQKTIADGGRTKGEVLHLINLIQNHISFVKERLELEGQD